MGRTFDRYGIEHETVEYTEYAFADKEAWSDWRIDQRLEDLEESSQIPHNPARRLAIEREMNHLLFEVSCRFDEETVTQPEPLPKRQNSGPRKGAKR